MFDKKDVEQSLDSKNGIAADVVELTDDECELVSGGIQYKVVDKSKSGKLTEIKITRGNVTVWVNSSQLELCKQLLDDYNPQDGYADKYYIKNLFDENNIFYQSLQGPN